MPNGLRLHLLDAQDTMNSSTVREFSGSWWRLCLAKAIPNNMNGQKRSIDDSAPDELRETMNERFSPNIKRLFETKHSPMKSALAEKDDIL